MMFEMTRLHGTTLILVTHDANLANTCDLQVRLRDGTVTVVKPGTEFEVLASNTLGENISDAKVYNDDVILPLDKPLVAKDGLAVLRHVALDASLALPPTKRDVIDRARYGANRLPVRYDAPHGSTAPIFRYPNARSREALARLERDGPVDAHDGFKLRYVNPATGGSPMPTMATFLQLLPRGFSGKPYRQTDGTVFSVVEGRGRATIGRGDSQWHYDFGPRDHFVVPSWHTLSLSASDECVLFSYSDRPVQQALSIWREERLA